MNKRNSNIKNTIREMVRKKFYKKYDGFWYAGELSKEFIMKYAIKDAKYCFVPNLIDERVYQNSYHMSKAQNKILGNYCRLKTIRKFFFAQLD